MSISETTEQRAILFADVCESTRIYETLGDTRALELINRLFAALEREVGAAGGVTVKTLGDGMVCQFREAEIVWENFNQWAPYKGIGALGEETEATPRDVPLHPGAARWFREHGYKV